jgi:hypothetical protein
LADLAGGATFYSTLVEVERAVQPSMHDDGTEAGGQSRNF